MTKNHHENAEEQTAQDRRSRAVDEVISAWPPRGGEQVARVIGLLRRANR